jgi:hypothetical protein
MTMFWQSPVGCLTEDYDLIGVVVGNGVHELVDYCCYVLLSLLKDYYKITISMYYYC